MPVLCTFGNVDDVACMKMNGRFAPFLIDALTADADKYLVCSVMNVPVIATTWFKGYIGIALYGLFTTSKVLWLNLCEVTLSCEILSVCIVWIAFWP